MKHPAAVALGSGNEYAARLYQIEASKNVWMAIAFSLAMRIVEDDPAAAVVCCKTEWKILHDNGIVPQKPRWTL